MLTEDFLKVSETGEANGEAGITDSKHVCLHVCTDCIMIKHVNVQTLMAL